MANFLTILVVIILIIALLITSIYILVYFCHPDDKGSTIGWVMKGIVILGLTLSWLQVLMLPFDVSNNRTFGGGMNMKVFWLLIYIISIIYILLITQIANCFYEADDSWSLRDKLLHSLGWALGTTIFFLIITLVLYFSIGKSRIPVTSIYCDIASKLINSTDLIIDDGATGCNMKEDDYMDIDSSFGIYLIACFLFVSWLLFAVFGGIGLAAVPLDYFYRFSHRPKHMKSEEIIQRKSKLLRDVEDLKLLGDNIRNLEAKGHNRKFKFTKDRRNYEEKCHDFRAGYMLVQNEYEVVNADKEIKKRGNCVYVCYYLLLPLGIFCSLLTLLWLIQFILSFFYIKNRRPGAAFISSMLIFFQDHDLAFLSFFFFALFCLYLLFCVIKGNFKFGVRILCCWDVYIMKKEGTYMDSFIFNIRLVLFSSFAIIHFCAESFTDYVAMTDIDCIMNIQIRYLKFFKFFFNYHLFHYLFFIIFLATLVYLLMNPSDSREYQKGKFAFRNKKGDHDTSGNDLTNANNTNNIISSSANE